MENFHPQNKKIILFLIFSSTKTKKTSIDANFHPHWKFLICSYFHFSSKTQVFLHLRLSIIYITIYELYYDKYI